VKWEGIKEGGEEGLGKVIVLFLKKLRVVIK
jgi:hypothetical protein